MKSVEGDAETRRSSGCGAGHALSHFPHVDEEFTNDPHRVGQGGAVLPEAPDSRRAALGLTYCPSVHRAKETDR